VGDAGLLFDPQDDEQLSVQMLRVLSDTAVRVDLRQRALKRAALFSRARAAREFHDVLNRAVESRSRARRGRRVPGSRITRDTPVEPRVAG
jgi:hypothetical protein